jgi:hypothetical protein
MELNFKNGLVYFYFKNEWRRQTVKQKIEVLQVYEDYLAGLAGEKPYKVMANEYRPEHRGPGAYHDEQEIKWPVAYLNKYPFFTYQIDGLAMVISLNDVVVKHSHEDRHRKQKQATRGEASYPDEATRDEWVKNFANYLRFDGTNLEEYNKQPIEADANDASLKTTMMLLGEARKELTRMYFERKSNGQIKNQDIFPYDFLTNRSFTIALENEAMGMARIVDIIDLIRNKEVSTLNDVYKKVLQEISNAAPDISHYGRILYKLNTLNTGTEGYNFSTEDIKAQNEFKNNGKAAVKELYIKKYFLTNNVDGFLVESCNLFLALYDGIIEHMDNFNKYSLFYGLTEDDHPVLKL